MATPGELCDQGEMQPWNVPLIGRQQPSRTIYVTNQFVEWAKNGLTKILPTHWGGEVKPTEQVTILMRSYRAGNKLEIGRQFKILAPHVSGVWEFKTGDVRIFGWFYARDFYIASWGADANYIKQDQKVRYGDCIDKAIGDRDSLDLTVPKFITSTDVRDVISN